jgi:hypothetical protein
MTSIVNTLQTCISVCIFCRLLNESCSCLLQHVSLPFDYLIRDEFGIASASDRAVAPQWFHLDVQGNTKEIPRTSCAIVVSSTSDMQCAMVTLRDLTIASSNSTHNSSRFETGYDRNERVLSGY